MTREFAIDCSGYDRLLLAMTAPEGAVGTSQSMARSQDVQKAASPQEQGWRRIFPGPDSPSSPPGSPPDKPHVPLWAQGLIFVVSLLLWNAILFIPFGGPGSAQIPYTEFVSQAASALMATVAIAVAIDSQMNFSRRRWLANWVSTGVATRSVYGDGGLLDAAQLQRPGLGLGG